MNIGLIVYDTLESVSGGYLYDERLVKHLRSKKDTVKIFSVPHHNLGRIASQRLADTLRNAQIDVLVQDELVHPSLVVLNQRLQKAGCCPIVSLVHNLSSSIAMSPVERKTCEEIEARYLRTIDGFIFNSNATRASVERFVDSMDQCVVAYPGKDHLRFQQSRVPAIIRDHGLRILFIGNLYPNKGLDVLITALSALHSKRWSLTIVGDPYVNKSYYHKIVTLVLKHHLASYVSFHGSVPREHTPSFFRSNDVLAVPSMYEGFGIVYVEALCFGLPVLATANGGAKEIITPGREGFLIEPGDDVSVTRFLSLLQNDRSLLSRMSKNASKRYAELPTWAESMERIRLFLHRLV